MIRVLLCDDHALIRRGIRDTLQDAGGIEVVGEVADYPSLREWLRSQQADVLVLDVNLPGRSGLDVLHVLKDEGTTVKVLIVSMYPEDQYALRALRAGLGVMPSYAQRLSEEDMRALASFVSDATGGGTQD